MKHVLCCAALLMAATSACGQSEQRAQILVLGTFHMANPGHDIFNMQADDVLSSKRQQEMAQVMDVLKKFKPTKIAIEADVNAAKRVQKEYGDYLAGTYTLTRNETNQIGYRLAKELSLPTVYAMDADGDFPIQRVINYAKANGKSAEFDKVMAGWGEMVKEQGEFLRTHSILETLEFTNSDTRAARDIALYFQLLRFGDPWEYAGPDLLAAFYQRNARIYNNMVRLIESPNDRILVIYGSGHLPWLRNDILNDPSVKLVKLSDLAGRSQ